MFVWSPKNFVTISASSTEDSSSISITDPSHKSLSCNFLGRSSNNVKSISVSSPLIEIDFCRFVEPQGSGSLIDFRFRFLSFSSQIGVEASSGELSEIPESFNEYSISLEKETLLRN